MGPRDLWWCLAETKRGCLGLERGAPPPYGRGCSTAVHAQPSCKWARAAQWDTFRVASGPARLRYGARCAGGHVGDGPGPARSITGSLKRSAAGDRGPPVSQATSLAGRMSRAGTVTLRPPWITTGSLACTVVAAKDFSRISSLVLH